MCRKLGVLIVLLALLVVVGCSENDITAWGMTGSHTDATGRLGLRQGNAEVFGTAKWGVASDAAFDDPDIVGGGVIFHLSQDATIEDTLQPSPLGPLLESLHAQPYAGAEFVGGTDAATKDFQTNWIFGTAFTLTPDGRIALTIEYVDGDQVGGDVHVGGMVRF